MVSSVSKLNCYQTNVASSRLCLSFLPAKLVEVPNGNSPDYLQRLYEEIQRIQIKESRQASLIVYKIHQAECTKHFCGILCGRIKVSDSDT